MHTISYKNVEYKVVCIDPSIETAGDGTTAATALKNLPAKLENNTCYLIRRTPDAATQSCLVSWQANNNLVNFMILGMPRATDKPWVQNLVKDEEINAAWKNDTAEYANVEFQHYGNKSSGAANATIISNKLEYCSIINTFCFRAKKTDYSSSSGYQTVVSALVGNNGAAKKTNILFQGCKLGVLNYNIESDEYLANNTKNTIDVNEKESKFSAFGCSYISIAAVNSFVCEDTIINYSTNYGGSYHSSGYNQGKVFYIDECDSVYINNVTVNTVADTATPAFLIRNVLHTATYSNITYNQILCNNRLTPLLYNCGYKRYGIVTINNININFKKFGLVNPVSTALDTNYIYGGLVLGYVNDDTDEGYGKELSVTNIKVNGDTSSVKLAEGNFLIGYVLADAQGSPQAPLFKDIDIRLHDTPSECFITTTNGRAQSIVSIAGYWNTTGNASMSFGSNYIGNKAAITRIENLYVKGKAGGNLSLKNVVANIDTLETALWLGNNTQVQINKMIYDKLDTNSVTLSGGGIYLRIKDLQVVETKSTNTALITGLYSGNANSIYIDKCNQEEVFDTLCDTNTEIEYVNSIAICANAGAEGKFIARNRNVLAQSWSVTRNGSDSAASLRLVNNTINDAKRLRICPNPYKGFTVTPTKLGVQNLVIYFAYRDFVRTQENDGKVGFDAFVNVPVRINNEVVYIPQCTTADWYDDTSTWSDPEAIAKKFVIPVDVKTLDPIEVKLAYNWYHTSGCVYVDPDMRLVPCE